MKYEVRASYFAPRTSYLVLRTSYFDLVLRTSYFDLVLRTSYLKFYLISPSIPSASSFPIIAPATILNSEMILPSFVSQ